MGEWCGEAAKDCTYQDGQSIEESHQVNAECISCSFKGSIEVKKGKKIYGMSCTECGKKTLRERRRPRRIKAHEEMDSDN